MSSERRAGTAAGIWLIVCILAGAGIIYWLTVMMHPPLGVAGNDNTTTSAQFVYQHCDSTINIGGCNAVVIGR